MDNHLNSIRSVEIGFINPRGNMNNFITLLEEYLLNVINDEFESYDDEMDEVLLDSFDNDVVHEKKDDVKVIVNLLKFEVIDNPENKDCSICSDDFEQSTNVAVLGCSHLFHHCCITEWGKYNPTCPICRKDIPYTDLNSKKDNINVQKTN